MSDTALAKLDIAKQALAEALDLTVILKIRVMAKMTEAVARARKAEEATALAMEIARRAERKAGEWLSENIPHAGAAKNKPNLGSFEIDDHESSRWQQIAELPEADFEKALADGNRTQNSLLQVYRDWKVGELRTIATKAQIPEGEFTTIVVDPPWPYDQTHWDPEKWRVANPYPQSSLEEIAARQIPSAKDSFLWLWTTNAFMREAHGILQGWGFEEKTILTWAKPKIGVGHWLRGQTEHCLLGVKGSPKILQNHAYSTLLNAPNNGHSVKPEEFYSMVKILCPGPYLDYYGRKHREGWSVFGTLELVAN